MIWRPLLLNSQGLLSLNAKTCEAPVICCSAVTPPVSHLFEVLPDVCQALHHSARAIGKTSSHIQVPEQNHLKQSREVAGKHATAGMLPGG